MEIIFYKIITEHDDAYSVSYADHIIRKIYNVYIIYYTRINEVSGETEPAKSVLCLDVHEIEKITNSLFLNNPTVLAVSIVL